MVAACVYNFEKNTSVLGRADLKISATEDVDTKAVSENSDYFTFLNIKKYGILLYYNIPYRPFNVKQI